MTEQQHPQDPSGRAMQAVAEAAAVLVGPHDIVGATIRLLIAAADSVGAAGAGLIIRRLGQDRLQLLAATSHRAEELELYQAQQGQGPCFDTVETGRPVTAIGAQEISDRWPAMAAGFERAGFVAVQTHPLRWHDDTIGALNLFWAADRAPGAGSELGGVFADLATLTIIHSDPVTTTDVLARTRTALDERTVIEQAKGVLADQQDLSMDGAYRALLDLAAQRGRQIGDVAAAIVARASAY